MKNRNSITLITHYATYLGSLAHNNSLEQERWLRGTHPIQHVGEVIRVPPLAGYGQSFHTQALALGNVFQGRVGIMKSGLARPAQKYRKDRAGSAPPREAVQHGDVLGIRFQPTLDRHEQLEHQAEGRGRRSWELVRQDLIVQHGVLVLHLGHIPDHVPAAVPPVEQMSDGRQLALGRDVPVRGGLHGRVAHGDEPIGDVDHLGIAEGIHVEWEVRVAPIRPLGEGGLQPRLFLLDRFAGLIGGVLGRGHDAAPPLGEVGEHLLLLFLNVGGSTSRGWAAGRRQGEAGHGFSKAGEGGVSRTRSSGVGRGRFADVRFVSHRQDALGRQPDLLAVVLIKVDAGLQLLLRRRAGSVPPGPGPGGPLGVRSSTLRGPFGKDVARLFEGRRRLLQRVGGRRDQVVPHDVICGWGCRAYLLYCCFGKFMHMLWVVGGECLFPLFVFVPVI